MRLAVSNLAIPQGSDVYDLLQLASYGVAGVEVAPTRIGDWGHLGMERLFSYRKMIEDAGLEISSLQSLFFGKNDCQLLGSDLSFASMRDHLEHVLDLGGYLGARVAVFGSPRNRIRGGMRPEAAWQLGRDRLHDLADLAAAKNMVLGLEPAPMFYGGDFLVTAAQVVAMVREVDHEGLRVHLDTGCAHVAGESIGAAVHDSGQLLAHFHASEPQLSAFETPCANHAEAAQALCSIEYGRWVVIEMLEQRGDPFGAIRVASAAVHQQYKFVEGY